MPRTLLDWSRPFGTVCGPSAGWRYEQDGKRFDAQGWEIAEESESTLVPELAPEDAGRKPKRRTS